jgi:hypothetical protein
VLKQSGLNGFPDLVGRRIAVVREQQRRLILVEGRPYMAWVATDRLMERIAVAQLCELNMGSQEQIAAAFGTSIRSVYRCYRAFAAKGSVGLLRGKRGPKEEWKITSAVRGKILYVFFKEGISDYEQIKQRLVGWGEQVGISSIRQVLLANGLVKEMPASAELARPGELFDPEAWQGQLEFDLDGAEGGKPGGRLADRSASAASAVPTRQHRGGGCAEVERKGRRYYSARQRMYLDVLKQGSYNSYAGGLMFSPFLSRYPFVSTIREVIDVPCHEGYSLEELCQTLFYFDVFGFRSMEDFKRVYPEEFGLLIGRACSPSHYTLRRFLHRVRERGQSEELIGAFARMFLKSALAQWGVLYIDGHFLPYYGIAPISKGWHGVRKTAMKGSYHFLGVDQTFNPWIFLIRSSAEDLLQKIPELIEKAKAAAGDAGVEQERVDELIVVFDREGFSGPLYGYLDGRDRDDGKKRAVFVSWGKYADKWVYEVPGEQFEKKAIVPYEIRKPQEIRYWETERRMSRYGKIRTIVIEREADSKRMAIYTNGNVEEISSERAVQLMCRRWGQENLIKELLGKHLIDYMPGYVIEPLESQPLVDNPRVRELKKQRATLASELHSLKVQLADQMLKGATDQSSWEQSWGNEVPLRTEIVKRQNEMDSLNRELEGLPAKLPYDQAHRGRQLQKLNYEKKRFLDCLKVYAYNVQSRMCELLLRYYDKPKEILPALSMIVKRGAAVKLQAGRLSVRLNRFRNLEIDYAARGLCEELNKMGPVTPDNFHLPILFEVS